MFKATGTAGKTKATVRGRQWESYIRERITNNATFAAGGQCVQCGGCDLPDLNRRGHFPINSSRANRIGLVRSGGLSDDSRFRCAFLRWHSSMDNATSCNSSSVIVCTCKETRRSSTHHGAGGSYPLLLQGGKNIFRTNLSADTSDHISQKTGYTRRIPYKTGIGIGLPLTIEAIQTPHASFFVSAHTHTYTMVGCMGPTSVGLVPLIASKANSVQSTANKVGLLGGGYIPSIKEAAIMATTPVLVHSQTAFIWRFIAFGASERQIIHVTAWTEREARSLCPSGCVAVFAARIRQEVCHVQ